MATRSSLVTPLPVRRALSSIGDNLATWRKLRRLTIAETADRAGVSVSTLARIESGKGASLEHTLAVARALGVLDALTRSVDPYESDLGRARADEALPKRIRRSARG